MSSRAYDQISKYQVGGNEIFGAITNDSPSRIGITFEGPDAPMLREQLGPVLLTELDRHAKAKNPQYVVSMEDAGGTRGIPQLQKIELDYRLHANAAAVSQDGANAINAEPLVNTATRIIAEIAEKEEIFGLQGAIEHYKREHNLAAAVQPANRAAIFPTTQVSVASMIQQYSENIPTVAC